MKRFLPLLLVLLALSSCGNGGRKPLVLREVIEVAGRQGVATDGKYWYVSGSAALYKYDLKGNLLLSNETPFETMAGRVNHIGDIDVFGGEIYAGCEYFMDGAGENIQIAVYDTETLQYKRSVNWNPESGQVECCGLAVDSGRGHVWMADWVDGQHLYCYDLVSGAYVGKVALDPVPMFQQGIYSLLGKMLISCDDGDADRGEADNVYIVDLYAPDGGLKVVAEPRLFRKMDDFRLTGEIEGLTALPDGCIAILSNRGARIVKGMPKGFYDGYDREIHEIYIYSR